MKYGRMTILQSLEGVLSITKVSCRCDCGQEKEVRLSHLTSGKTISCGCYRRSLNTLGRTGLEHTVTGTRLYRIWGAMRQRCSNPNSDHYKYYGGKGVKVCDEWEVSFKEFYLWANRSGYEEDLSIDRIDSDQDYCPENCRWVSISENTKSMLKHNFRNSVGMFSQETKDKIRATNRANLGVKIEVWREGLLVVKCSSLGEAAEYVKEAENLDTTPLQIKKNISACIHGKRKKCHGYYFVVQSEQQTED